MNQPIQSEEVLMGPIAVAPGEGDISRNIVVRIGVKQYRIPIPTQGCQELAKALSLSDEELAQASEQQVASGRIVIPNGFLNGNQG